MGGDESLAFNKHKYKTGGSYDINVTTAYLMSLSYLFRRLEVTYRHYRRIDVHFAITICTGWPAQAAWLGSFA